MLLSSTASCSVKRLTPTALTRDSDCNRDTEICVYEDAGCVLVVLHYYEHAPDVQ